MIVTDVQTMILYCRRILLPLLWSHVLKQGTTFVMQRGDCQELPNPSETEKIDQENTLNSVEDHHRDWWRAAHRRGVEQIDQGRISAAIHWAFGLLFLRTLPKMNDRQPSEQRFPSSSFAYNSNGIASGNDLRGKNTPETRHEESVLGEDHGGAQVPASTAGTVRSFPRGTYNSELSQSQQLNNGYHGDTRSNSNSLSSRKRTRQVRLHCCQSPIAALF